MDAYDEEKEAFRVFKVARLTQLNIQGAFTKKPFTPKVYSDAPWMNQDKISVTIHVHKKIIDQFVERLGNDAIHSINDELYEVVLPSSR
ncbi:WYL domain-containing protein [Vagococcus fluvialis]|uniref:WYL domain-containing protein n=1 Tax=Vagococcus fluvialis TaxID=2738 RepID=UPI0037BC5A0E